MQLIEVQKIDERGNVLEETDINFAEVVIALQRLDNFKEKYPVVSTIDPYGNTLINHLQKPAVIQELKALARQVPEAAQGQINRTTKLLEQAGVHEYVKFLGD
jgi:hypothetical protein